MLDFSRWQPLVDAIAGRRCLYVANTTTGNWGDRLIDLGTVRFLRGSGVDFTRVPESRIHAVNAAEFDLALLFGSGSLGARCTDCVARRRRILSAVRRPAILLPSTAWDCWERLDECEYVFLRDHVSMAICRDAYRRVDLLPDLAEAWQAPEIAPHTDCLTLLRRDEAGLWWGAESRDCAEAGTLGCYVAEIASGRHVVTDRLHVAIAAKAIGRNVSVLPTRWHKLRGYYETWWRGFDAGVQFLDRPTT